MSGASFSIRVNDSAFASQKAKVADAKKDLKALEKELDAVNKKGEKVGGPLNTKLAAAQQRVAAEEKALKANASNLRRQDAAGRTFRDNLAGIPGGGFGQDFAKAALGEGRAAQMGGMIRGAGSALGAIGAVAAPIMAAIGAYKAIDETLTNRSTDFARAIASGAQDRLMARSVSEARRTELAHERMRENMGINQLMAEDGKDTAALAVAKASSTLNATLNKIPIVGGIAAKLNLLSLVSERMGAGRENRLGRAETMQAQNDLGLSVKNIDRKAEMAQARVDGSTTFGFMGGLRRGLTGETTEDVKAKFAEVQKSDKAQADEKSRVWSLVESGQLNTAMASMKKYNPGADMDHQVWADPAALWTSMEGARVAARRWAASNTQRAAPRTGD